jgi:acetyltransferase-like isoleucine patch superfamily enzyme
MRERLSGLGWRLDRRRVWGGLLRREADAAGWGLLAEGRVRVSRPAARTRLAFGDQVYLYRDVAFYLDADGATVEVGDRTFLNRRTEVISQRRVTIGADCLISWDVSISDTDYHQVDGSPAAAPVTIEDLAWIGARATILKGVTIGSGAVVAAGAVVTRSVPPRTLVAGVPARVVRTYVTWS